MPPFRCRSCGYEQRLSIFERTCKRCGGTNLEPFGETSESERA